MSQFKFLATIVMLFAMVVAGCKKDDGGTNTPTTTTPTQPTAPTPTTFGGFTPTNVMAVVRTSVVTVVPIIGTVLVDANAATAAFGNPGTDKGTVTVTPAGGAASTLGKLTTSGVVSYIFPDPSNPLATLTLNTSAIAVTFSAQNHALSSNSVTVPGQVTLTAPAASANVPRSAALNVTWTVTGGAGTRHAVFIVDAQGHSVFKDGQANGVGSFTTAELGGLSAGIGWVYALTYNFNLVNTNTAVLVGEAVAISQINLQ